MSNKPIWTAERVDRIKQVIALTTPISLDAPLNIDDPDYSDTLRDVYIDPAPTPEEVAIQTSMNELLMKTMEQALSPKEIQILKLRFGLKDRPHTLDEIGKVYNVTRERIRQIEAKAIMRLRRYMKKHGLLEESEWGMD